jgi:tetratricopeptide (TPR) repeat protein
VSFKINMSAGELFDLIMPAAFVFSALLSTWVLASARRRLPVYYAVALAAGTLFLPLIVFPIYLVITLWRKRSEPPKRWRYALPLLYAVIALAGIAAFFYLDRSSVDAHLARATRAKLVEDTSAAIREYRQALTLDDDPHTHKLLAIELVNAGYVSEAISEFRLAQQGGEPDDSIHYHLGLLLEHLNLNEQAKLEFQNFLLTETCKQPDGRCEDARMRVSNK